MWRIGPATDAKEVGVGNPAEGNVVAGTEGLKQKGRSGRHGDGMVKWLKRLNELNGV